MLNYHAMQDGTLRNLAYGYRVRIAGCQRRGQPTAKVQVALAVCEYELRVRELEREGLTRSDAQGVADAELMTNQRATGAK